MINLTDKQIKDISEDLDGGMACYYNKKTGEIKSVIDFDANPVPMKNCGMMTSMNWKSTEQII